MWRMTNALPLFLTKLFGLSAKTGSTPELIAQPADEPTATRLRNPMVVLASRGCGRGGCKLMATEMGPQQMIFHTNVPLMDEEMVQVEMLLDGHGMIKMGAQVCWLQRTGGQGVRGELTLWASSEHQEAIRAFLARHLAHRR